MYGGGQSRTDNIELAADEFLIAYSALGTAQTITGKSKVKFNKVKENVED